MTSGEVNSDHHVVEGKLKQITASASAKLEDCLSLEELSELLIYTPAERAETSAAAHKLLSSVLCFIWLRD